VCYSYCVLGKQKIGTLDRDAIVVSLSTYLSTHPGDVAAAYLFGSVARGEATSKSDVDIGLLFSTSPAPTLEALPTRLEADLARAIGAPLQIVVLNRAPIDLVHRVLRDGILLLDRDRSSRIAFEVRARNLYWDLLPTLRRYRRMEGKTG